jgi:hypothetical protein
VGPAPYRTSPRARAPDPYLAAWAHYRDRRWLKWVLFFTWPAIAWVATGMLHPRDDEGGLWVCLSVAIAALGVMSWLGTFVCPRCRARMYVRGSLSDVHPDGCRSCGIEVGTPKYPEG